MIKHVVLWTIKDLNDGLDKKASILKMKETLESMQGKIEGLISLQVGLNKNESTDAYDICLITEHKTWQDLKNYQEHPIHREVGAYVAKIKKNRAVADFEI